MSRQARQRGTTLLELLAAMAISAIIMSGVVTLIFQEFKGTTIAKASVNASHEIGNAARWLIQDAMMAENTNLVEGTDPADNLTLTWIERYEFANIPHSCSYSLSDTRLMREYDGNVAVVAQDISEIEFSQSGHLLTVSIGCTSQWWNPDRTVRKTYQIYFRTAEGSLA